MATLSVAGFSTFTYSFAGGSLVFNTPFALGVLSPAHVQAYVVGEVDGLGDQIYRACTYTATSGTTTVVGPLPEPCDIVLQRTVPKDALFVSFASGADVTRTNIDVAVKYTLMALHETLDGRWSNVAFDALTDAVNDAIAARDDALAAMYAAQVSQAASEAWAQSPTAPDEFNPTSKSAKTWAGEAGASAIIAQTYGGLPFASRADAIAATIPSTVTAIAVLHNGVWCKYVYNADGTALTTAGGRKWSPVAPVYLEHWGVTPSSTYTNATTDYTAEVQAAALFTNGDLIFTGWVKIRDKITAAVGCRVHCPAGHDRGGFVCRSDFNLVATSVFQPGSSAAEGSPIGDIGFWFEHTAATASGLRADLVQYPWAVGLAGPDITRSTFDRIRIMGAWNGVNAKGNAGGLKGHLIEISAFNEIGNINGVLDFCHIDNVHIWPFALTTTPTLRDIYYDGVASFNIGDCDGLHIDNLSTFRVKVVCRKTDNILPLTIGVVKLDGDGARWVQTSGLVTIAQLYSTKTTTPTLNSIQVSGGNLYVGTGAISGGETVPQVLVDGGSFTMNGGELYQNSTNKIAARVTSGSMTLNGVLLRWTGTRTQPMIEQSGTGVLRMDNCRPTQTTTAQTLVSLATDVAGSFVNYLSMGIHLLSVTLTGPILGRYLTSTALTVLGSADSYPVGAVVTSGQTTETAAVANNLPALAGAGGDARWWVVDTSGQSVRTVQRATEVFGIGTTRGRTFIRVKQDATWYAWTEI